MKEQDRIWTLIARKLANEVTDKELEELQELLGKNSMPSAPVVYNAQVARKRPSQKTSLFSLFSQGKDLLENYFKIAWQRLSRNKSVSTGKH